MFRSKWDILKDAVTLTGGAFKNSVCCLNSLRKETRKQREIRQTYVSV